MRKEKHNETLTVASGLCFRVGIGLASFRSIARRINTGGARLQPVRG
jgi:hypothetical protein